VNVLIMAAPLGRVAQSTRAVLQASDCLRDEAALELGAGLAGVTGKQLKRAGVPTCGAYAVSRAMNGGDNNPLFKIAALFLAMRRMGLGRERAQRIVNWLQEVVDAIWPETEEADLAKVLEKDQELDVTDDTLRLRAAMGCAEAARDLLAVKRKQAAHAPTVIFALRKVGG
jgi:hypothetical protein